MNKANVWSSSADVLNDLKEATGGNPGVSDLDNYVAVGTRPPPDRRESIDEDEFQYRFGVNGNGLGGFTAPDLDGISQMLQLVNEDPFTDNEPKTVFRNTMTDEIRISKLNPNVTEFVPFDVRRPSPQNKQQTPKKSKFKTPNKLNHTNQSYSKRDTEIKESSENKLCDIEKKYEQKKTNTQLIGENNNTTINKFKENHSASNSINSEIKVTCGNKIDVEKKDEGQSYTPSDLLSGENNNSTINESKLKHKQSASNSMNSVSTATVSNNYISLDKKVDVSNMKSEEIEEIKMKIKSKIINSSGNSIQHKKEKNVAMATLLRLYATAPAVTAEKPVKLITPDYFKALPNGTPEAEKEFDVKDHTEPVEQFREPATSTSRSSVVYKDPFVEESIAKVNNWFDNEDSPKPKQLPVQPPAPAPAPVPVPPVQLKEVLSFKKKNASSPTINSPKNETSEKKKKITAFVPSAYANDLLQKYEKNAKSQVAPKEDWRDALERQLMEKDEEIKKKRCENQERTSPNSRGGN